MQTLVMRLVKKGGVSISNSRILDAGVELSHYIQDTFNATLVGSTSKTRAKPLCSVLVAPKKTPKHNTGIAKPPREEKRAPPNQRRVWGLIRAKVPTDPAG